MSTDALRVFEAVTGVLLAILAALLNATSSVLQRRAARDEGDERAFSIRLLLDLVRRPVWLGGILAVLVGFLVQAAALTTGRIASVQALLVAELPFTLVLASLVFHARMRRREWSAVVLMTGGLALFVYALAPTGGDPGAVSTAAWLIGAGVSLAVVAALVARGRRSTHQRRAAWLGVATGAAFGFNAALVAGVGAAYRNGLSGVFTAWQTYAVIVVGPASFFLLQNALQAGSLFASQPGLTLTDPLVAIAWGLAVFGEQARGGGWIVGMVAGAGLIGFGTVVLAHSPLLSGTPQRTRAPDGPAVPRTVRPRWADGGS